MSQLETRREFLKKTVAVASVVALPGAAFASGQNPGKDTTSPVPWYRKTLRWGQTNITEIDPERYDIAWWRKYWKRTETQGVVINAGGIFAYYPSNIPLHRQAARLNGRDLFGELCRAAHEEGLAVFARMDSNRAHEEFYKTNPGWFALDAAGKPYKAGDLFVTCVNGPYYEQHIPSILREIAERYHPEGFTDNSWSGLGRSSPCYCANCEKRFQDRSGHPIPRQANWSDPIYRDWIKWNYQRRLEIWDLNNRTTKAAGGPDCVWIGMNSGSISGQAQNFRDMREICRRAEILMLDHQSRDDSTGFQQNGETGKLVHGLMGWDKLAPESMAMYQMGNPWFRVASKPQPEARMWMLEGIAGGIQPWWHHVGAYHEDRRMYHTAEPVYRWHKVNEQYLVNRRPLATVGVVWSQQNLDFYGRDDAGQTVEQPWRGVMQALVRARIPYLPVHADDIERDASQFAALVLPNLAAVSDKQLDSIRRFVNQGGGLLASGESTLFNESGEPRSDFGLADLFGAHVDGARRAKDDARYRKDASANAHTYLRLSPELRANMDGPHIAGEPAPIGSRHEVLRGFEETDIIPYGGMLDLMRLDPGVQVPLTFVPPFPTYPPETAWMREPKTDIPGLVLTQTSTGARIAFLPADVDRRFARYNLPDHGDLLGNLVRWIAKDSLPLCVTGPGLVDCHLYRQGERLIVHLVNLTNSAAWRQPVHELISIGPLQMKIKLPTGVSGQRARLLVGNQKISAHVREGWAVLEIKSILDHEVVLIG